MKYRHSFHAGNFADVHKHVTLLALIAALARKDKGILYLETHAGRGAYDLGVAAGGGRGARAGLGAVLDPAQGEEELAAYARAVNGWRAAVSNPLAYPGSPLLAAAALRPQDRAVLIEQQPAEAHALERALHDALRGSTLHGAAAHATPHVHVESGDGYERMRAHLPPAERRGLTLVDPPYEDTARDFERAAAAAAEALQRFPGGVFMLWYPIKDARDTDAWRDRLDRRLGAELLVSELWVHPCDSKVALNGSGLLIFNPPWLIAERMRAWLPALQRLLDGGGAGGSLVSLRNAK